MKATIARWGNSLAVRLPKDALLQARLAEGDVVEISVRDGALALLPRREEPSLSELVAAIAPENLHGETFVGPHGAELW
ncbi:MAG: AbrB/MazE/SpoVT family DNA-binding domain-containing protein [Candidatus Eremiobacteraeota bacterium]|uniref:Antitoxin of the ChpA-ChpR toxin-antitoxin system n=1 Tax=mine drainage metagenome TaxID=410659 RepID=E6PD22_9ZZZZ|nr:AbrB/MazE/SpoVT family DNA-binding domain-containing protein [Candidatus Eremiobacteraeota bacterium]